MNSLPSKLLTQVPEQTRMRAWGLSCRVKAVKGGGSHSNPPGISCSGMWEQGPGPPGCCRMGWGEGCVGVTELVTPRSSVPAYPSPAGSLSRAPGAWNLFATESPWHPGVNLLSKRRQGGWSKVKTTKNNTYQSFLPRQGAEPESLTFLKN